MFHISNNFPSNSVCDLFLALTHTLDEKRVTQSTEVIGYNKSLFKILSGISVWFCFLFI